MLHTLLVEYWIKGILTVKQCQIPSDKSVSPQHGNGGAESEKGSEGNRIPSGELFRKKQKSSEDSTGKKGDDESDDDVFMTEPYAENKAEFDITAAETAAGYKVQKP